MLTYARRGQIKYAFRRVRRALGEEGTEFGARDSSSQVKPPQHRAQIPSQRSCKSFRRPLPLNSVGERTGSPLGRRWKKKLPAATC